MQKNPNRKKIVLFGSPLCENCGPVKDVLTAAGVNFTFVDITSGMAQLQYFLKIRDDSPAFAAIRGSGKIGIPCLQVDEGVYHPHSPEEAEEMIKTLGLIW